MINNLWQYVNVASMFIPLYQKSICDNILMLQILYSLISKYQIILFHIKAIKAYCFSCMKITANKNSSVRRTKQSRLMFVLSCAICGKKENKI